MPLPAQQSELDIAEEAASTDREVVNDAILAHALQTALYAFADEEEETTPTARVPQQSATSEPTGGGSSSDDL